MNFLTEILSQRPEGGIWYHPGLVGATGTDPCYTPNAAQMVIGQPEMPVVCYANCDGSTGTLVLTPSDFTRFLSKYRAGDAYANCLGLTSAPIFTPAQFTCFLGKFRAGC